MLSEEAADDSGRLQAERVWIIDPLDGTRKFSEFERDDWGVHVALWERGELVAGTVALSARGVMSVVTGETDAYMHAGGSRSGTPRGRWPWPAQRGCTPAAWMAPMMYNNADRWLFDLIISRSDVAQTLLALLNRMTP